MAILVKVLRRGEAGVLDSVAPEVFDNPINPVVDQTKWVSHPLISLVAWERLFCGRWKSDAGTIAPRPGS